MGELKLEKNALLLQSELRQQRAKLSCACARSKNALWMILPRRPSTAGPATLDHETSAPLRRPSGFFNLFIFLLMILCQSPLETPFERLVHAKPPKHSFCTDHTGVYFLHWFAICWWAKLSVTRELGSMSTQSTNVAKIHGSTSCHLPEIPHTGLIPWIRAIQYLPRHACI